MANPNFIPDYSTNQIFRNLDQSRCLTDDLDDIDDSIEALETGKADTDHAHTGYAPADHEHTEYADAEHTHTGFASSDHTHAGYAEANHEHDGYAASDHTHDGYAASSHTHEQASIPGLIAALASKAEATHDHTLAQIVGLVAALAAKADLVDGKVPASQLPSYVDDVIEGHLHNATTFYENISDDVSDTVEVVPESGKVYFDTTTNKSYRWSGTSYVEIPASLALGETSSTAYRGDHGKTAYDHSQDGTVHVTEAQKTAWNGKANGDHNHNTNYIPKALQFTKDSGDVEFSFGANSGKNILTEIASWNAGMHTAYAIGGTLGNPDGTDSFRYLVHKTSASIGWALAFGGQGSAFINYVHNGVFRGWKRVDNGSDAPLWTGHYYMGNDHTVTPSKKLSECNKGWVLVWSDYDSDTNTVNSFDQCTCVITKKNASGANWDGEGYMCVLPRYSDETGTTDAICIKNINVYDDKLVGKDKNKVGENRRDVVLRAVYEF